MMIVKRRNMLPLFLFLFSDVQMRHRVMIKRRCRYHLDGSRESQLARRNVRPVYYDKMKAEKKEQAEKKEHAELLNLGSV